MDGFLYGSGLALSGAADNRITKAEAGVFSGSRFCLFRIGKRMVQ